MKNAPFVVLLTLALFNIFPTEMQVKNPLEITHILTHFRLLKPLIFGMFAGIDPALFWALNFPLNE